jgi:hypothetical protein
VLLAACCCLLIVAAAAKPGRSTLDPKKGYKTKTGSTSSVTLTLTHALRSFEAVVMRSSIVSHAGIPGIPTNNTPGPNQTLRYGSIFHKHHPRRPYASTKCLICLRCVCLNRGKAWSAHALQTLQIVALCHKMARSSVFKASSDKLHATFSLDLSVSCSCPLSGSWGCQKPTKIQSEQATCLQRVVTRTARKHAFEVPPRACTHACAMPGTRRGALH